MATQRDRPYGRFHFLVSLGGDSDPSSVEAGFMEVTGLGLDIEVIEYRTGNDPSNHPHKLTGLTRASDVTLKRGVIGVLDLWEWMTEVSSGDQNALRTVTIQLLSEDRTEVAQQWKLIAARPVKYTGPELNARAGEEIALEELTLSCEGIELS